MKTPFHKTFYFKTADFADDKVKSLFCRAFKDYADAAIHYSYCIWDTYEHSRRLAACWQNQANWEGPDGAAEKARWLEENGGGWTAEELDAFQVGEEGFNKFYNEDIEKYPWGTLFTRHHLQDFFHQEFNVSGDTEEWELDPSADVWKITCDSRERYAFFFALFTAVAQESGTTLRFYCDGLMYELTPGAQMPEVDHSDRECWRKPNEPKNNFYADSQAFYAEEDDFYVEEDDDNIPF